MKVQQSNSQHTPATTGPPTTARRLSYPGWRLAWGLLGWPGDPADRQTDTQTEKRTDRQKSKQQFSQSGLPWQDIASTA